MLKISKELVMHRLEQAKNELADAKLLYNNKVIYLQIIELIIQYFIQLEQC